MTEFESSPVLSGDGAQLPIGLEGLIRQRDGGKCQICGNEDAGPVETRDTYTEQEIVRHGMTPRYMLVLCGDHASKLARNEIRVDYDAYRDYVPEQSYPLTVWGEDGEEFDYDSLHFYQTYAERLGEHSHQIKGQVSHLNRVEGVSNVIRGMLFKEFRELRLHVLDEGVDPNELPGDRSLTAKEGENWSDYCERVFDLDVNTVNAHIRDYEQVFESGMLDRLAEQIDAEDEEERLDQAFGMASSVPPSTRLEVTRLPDIDQRAELLNTAVNEGLSTREVRRRRQRMVQDGSDNSGPQPSCANCLHAVRLRDGETVKRKGNLMKIHDRGIVYCEVYGDVVSSMTADRAINVAENCPSYVGPEDEIQ